MTNSSFGKKLQQLRKEKGWTQDELGKRVGVHGRSIGAYEAGINFPSRKTLTKLASIFEVPMTFFMVEEEERWADIPVQDRELLQSFLEADKLSEESRRVIKSVIDGMVAKERMEDSNR